MKCKCGEINEEMFYDSCKSKCKDCIKKTVNRRRKENIEKIKEYDRNRPNREERKLINKERVERYKTENPEKYKKIQDQKLEWAKKNRLKRNAHTKIQRALLKGTVKRLYYCEHCKIENVLIQAHHHDYNKPLDVIWLCVPCHNEEHKRLNEITRGSYEN